MRAFIATTDKHSLISSVLLSLPLELFTGRATFSFSRSNFDHHTTVRRQCSSSEQLAVLHFRAAPSIHSERPSHPCSLSWASFTLLTWSVLYHPRSPSWTYPCRGGTFVYGAILLSSTSRSHVCDSHESGSCYCALV